MKLRNRVVVMGALAALLFTGASFAQVAYGDIKVGTTLDEKGIGLGTFAKPLPLPPGSWLVVARNDTAIGLSGGRSDGPASTPSISLTLKSADSNSAIVAMVLDFTPDSSRVNWGNSPCAHPVFSIADDFGTSPSSLTYACGHAQFGSGGFKALISGAPTSSVAWAKDRLSGLAPYTSEMPDATAFFRLAVNRFGGRNITYIAYAKAPVGVRLGDPFELASRAWIKSTGQALIDFVGNSASAIPAFSAPGAGAVAQTSPRSSVPFIDSVKVGSVVNSAIALEAFAKPLPLPPGNWLVAARNEEFAANLSGKMSPRISLTLRNNDTKAGIAAMVVAFNLDRFTSSIDSYSCDSTKYLIVETFGTTAKSDTYACLWGGPYTHSMKKRVEKAATGTGEYDKKYLAPLEPYIADLPEAHLWLSLNVARSDSRRLQYTFFARKPADIKPGDPFELATRAWIQSAGHGLIDYLENKDSNIATFPLVQASSAL